MRKRAFWRRGTGRTFTATLRVKVSPAKTRKAKGVWMLAKVWTNLAGEAGSAPDCATGAITECSLPL